MPSTLRLLLEVPAPLQVYPARLHGAAGRLLEPPSVGHHAQRKPYCAAPVFADGRYASWQLGWLPDSRPDVAPEVVELGPVRCPVRRCVVSTRTFAELAASAPTREAQVELDSPMYFSRNGRDHPLPDPVLVLRSALGRWNAHAPASLAVPDELSQRLLAAVHLSGMDGATVHAPVSASMTQIGYLGSFGLALPRSAELDVAVALGALASFGEIAGFGAQTTHGFGAVHAVSLRTDHSWPARSDRGTRRGVGAGRGRSPHPDAPGTQEPWTAASPGPRGAVPSSQARYGVAHPSVAKRSPTKRA